ncbi:MAG: response regulator transcription factor [Rhodobacteraceae bacterium]|nr:response regulator transcription factor [Paracoccaceae bacterium]
MTLPNPIKIIIADDHPLVTEGIKGILESFDTIKVIATVSDGQELVDCFEALNADVILLDLNMPRLNGLGATEIMLERNPDTKILILSMHDSPEYISTAMRYGAKGYLLKDIPIDKIVNAIEKVHAGGTYLCTGSEQQLIPEVSGREPLTAREQTILLELASGKSNKQVAFDLDISVRTVETHRKNIKRKLGISTTAGLTRYAMEHGVLQRSNSL